ncbi:MAG: DUF4838 domain-containing protein [Planctomycetota bacterium]|jgi:hypothetical protein
MNLNRYIQIITGSRLPVVAYDKFDKTKSKYKYHIWIGRQPEVDEKFGKILDSIDQDGFLIACEDNNLYIAGQNYEQGTHTAPFDLLERAAGCRWFFEPKNIWTPVKKDNPTGPGEIIPQADIIKIPGNTYILEQPVYKNRWFRVAPRHAWRLARRDDYHHNLLKIVKPDTHGKTNPEYFPLVKGKRHVPPVSRSYDFQPCVSNPAVTKLAVEAAAKVFDSGLGCFSLGMNDSGKYCECKKCMAIVSASAMKKLKAVAPDEKRLYHMKNAYIYFKWYNEVAKRLYKKYPQKRLGCLAYASLSSLPEGMIKLHKMIVPYLTRDSAQLFDKHEIVEFRETIDKWSKLAHRMGIYEYIYGQAYYIPRIYNRYILKNIKEQYQVGCDGFYAEAYPQWRLDAPKYYFIAKMLWNNKYSIRSLKDDYYTRCFGPANKIMEKYFDSLEETWCTQTLESGKSNYRWYYNPRQLEIFSPDKCDEAIAFLDQSIELLNGKIAATEDAKEKKLLEDNLMRVNYFYEGIKVTKNLAYRYAYNAEIEKLQKEKKDPMSKEMLEAYSKFIGTGTVREIYDAKEKLGFDTTSKNTFHSFNYQWNNHRGVFHYIYDVSNKVFDEGYKFTEAMSKEGIQASIDKVVEKLKKDTEIENEKLWQSITAESKNNSFFFIPAVGPDQGPVIDGKIEEGEWGEPIYSGLLTTAYTVAGKFPHETKIYGRLINGEEKIFMLAFDCTADPEIMGGDVKPEDKDTRYPLKMAKDSAIAISLRPRKSTFRSWRFNILGSVQGFKGESKVSKSDKGWQLELAIPVKKAFSLKHLIEDPNYMTFSFARYERVKKKNLAKKEYIATTCGLMRPVHKSGNRVGHGNFDTLMSFIWGPKLIFGMWTQGNE